MSTESFTNALLIALISLISACAMVGYKKINELISEVRSLLLSDLNHKKDIISLREDVEDHESRIKALEKNNNKKNY